ncbi:MAG: hypothetical protein SD837_20685 [Candidatus Electrothrix scaldis]|nr:MAG: hypothetical protein SD837_20685 [Candidatus Electrothrix sp. GW3-3]
MKKTIWVCTFLMGSLFCLSQQTANAETECYVFGNSRRGGEQMYNSCDDCFRQSRRCEQRCFDTNTTCTAMGNDRYGSRITVQGPPAKRKKRARKKALQQCRRQGLMNCTVLRCTDSRNRQPISMEVCRSQPTRGDRNSRDWDRGRNSRVWDGNSRDRGVDSMIWDNNPRDNRNSENRNRTRTERPRNRNNNRNTAARRPQPQPQPTQRYVKSWQHLKGRCEGHSYPKVAQQCGGRGVWHGIYCRVTWSDGRTEDLHGKVDLKDPYGRAYCTRRTRPANFNCVSRCDNTNGPLMNLPRP